MHEGLALVSNQLLSASLFAKAVTDRLCMQQPSHVDAVATGSCEWALCTQGTGAKAQHHDTVPLPLQLLSRLPMSRSSQAGQQRAQRQGAQHQGPTLDHRPFLGMRSMSLPKDLVLHCPQVTPA